MLRIARKPFATQHAFATSICSSSRQAAQIDSSPSIDECSG
jgi:hypothetical protein